MPKFFVIYVKATIYLLLHNLHDCTIKELRTILKTRKYPKMVVEKGIEKAIAIPQEQLRSEKLRKKDGILPFISTHNPNNPNMFPKVREIYGNLQTSETLGKIFAKHKLIDCNRQPFNLKRLLFNQTFQQIIQLSKQQNAEKVAFVVIILPRLNSLNLRNGTNNLF